MLTLSPYKERNVNTSLNFTILREKFNRTSVSMLENMGIIYGKEGNGTLACTAAVDNKPTTHFPEVTFAFSHVIFVLNLFAVFHLQHAAGVNLLCSLSDDDLIPQSYLSDHFELCLSGDCPLSVLQHF